MIFSLINIVSKIGTSSATAQKNHEPPSPALSPTNKSQPGTPPSFTTAVLSVPGTTDTSIIGLSEGQLKRQGLECLSAILRSLVAWGTTAGKAVDEPPVTPAKSHIGDDFPVTPEVDKLYASSASVEALRQPTPDILDDPSKFESAKQKKTTLLEGIKKFNFKPKRVRRLSILQYVSLIIIPGRSVPS